MNQKLSDWASIAEIVSGVAVVITLIFLVLGIRDNTEITRASMYAQSIDSVIAFRELIATDPEMTRLWVVLMDGEYESLEELDQIKATNFMANAIQIYEKAYFVNQYGLLGRAEWSRFEPLICSRLAQLRQSKDLNDLVLSLLTQEFRDYSENLCAG